MGAAVGFLTYYAALFALSIAVRHPAILIGFVVVFLLRNRLPDPVVWMRTAGKIRDLEGQIAANASNLTARRDLARIYLERMRPKRALLLLDEARQREPENGELLYLTGMARLRTGDPEGALDALGHAVEVSPRVAQGDVYWHAGHAHRRLGNHDASVAAFERLVAANTSRVDGYLALAQAQKRAGERDEAKRTLRTLRDTYRSLPGYLKRKFFWARVAAAIE